jgi:sulfatase maturation enzyme AslB (radical SAM superfamily)
MQANNLTICVPKSKEGPLCDKNCSYCVTKMSGYVEHDYDMMQRNFKKVITVANNAHVSNVMITGKGEPLLNYYGVAQICQVFKQYPIEIQTNGIWLKDNIEAIQSLKGLGIDIFAFSIDEMNFLDDLVDIFDKIKSVNLTVRVSINVTDKLSDWYTFANIFHIIKKYKIDQLLFRNINIPKRSVTTSESIASQQWIKRHVPPARYNVLQAQMTEFITTENNTIRKLPHGVFVYDIDGVSVAFSDYCVQEYNNTIDIRSLIMLENGHLVTSWDKKSSRLF